jgi:hypothetical protein
MEQISLSKTYIFSDESGLPATETQPVQRWVTLPYRMKHLRTNTARTNGFNTSLYTQVPLHLCFHFHTAKPKRQVRVRAHFRAGAAELIGNLGQCESEQLSYASWQDKAAFYGHTTVSRAPGVTTTGTDPRKKKLVEGTLKMIIRDSSHISSRLRTLSFTWVGTTPMMQNSLELLSNNFWVSIRTLTRHYLGPRLTAASPTQLKRIQQSRRRTKPNLGRWPEKKQLCLV